VRYLVKTRDVLICRFLSNACTLWPLAYVNENTFVGALFSIEDVKQRFMNKTDVSTSAGGTGGASQRKDSTSSVGSSTAGGKGRYPNRYLGTAKPEKKVEAAKEEEEEEESSESESSESESEEEESDSSPPVPVITPAKKNIPEAPKTKETKADIGGLLARSANARDRNKDVPDSPSVSSAVSSSYTPRSRRLTEEPPTPPVSVSSYRRNRVTSPPVRETEKYGTTATSNSTSGIGSSRYAKLLSMGLLELKESI